MYETIHHVFHTAVEYGVLLLEIIGAVLIFIAAVKGLILLIRKDPNSKIELAEGIATALGFLLASEALESIMSPDWQTIGTTCAILAMRAAMHVLIHWEVVNEKKEHSEHQ